MIRCFSEPYQPTGGQAAQGVLNQLGRPSIEPLEVLVREAVQNCWDARREELSSIRVEIGRRTMDDEFAGLIGTRVLPDPPPGVPLGEELKAGADLLYFADFGTAGLGGPTRADHVAAGELRDFVDFVRNIGQPPDKDLGGGSYGFGKAAFYIASRARTIIIDTLCRTPEGLERRLIGAALGENYTSEGQTYTGRHWWGVVVDDVPEPLTGEAAAEIAELLGLPARDGHDGLGTTIAIVSHGLWPDDDAERVMPFISEALLWNFWPKVTGTPGGAKATIRFALMDNGRRLSMPDPRTHERLRGFVEAMDRLRSERNVDDPFVIDRDLASQRPKAELGRLVIQKGAVAPATAGPPDRAMPKGMRQTLEGVHHVALMRNAELVVKYLPGATPTTGHIGYSGVFRCSLSTDNAFRSAEPPTHDDWVPESVPKAWDRRYVNIALTRIEGVCREAAGLSGTTTMNAGAEDIPLGEFADSLARLMPGFEGPGARRSSKKDSARGRRRRRRAPGANATSNTAGRDGEWVESPSTGSQPGVGPGGGDADEPGDTGADGPSRAEPMRPRPRLRVSQDPEPTIADDGSPVMRFPFELRPNGNRVLLQAKVHVMTNDGESVEHDPPSGWERPAVRSWVHQSGARHAEPELTLEPDEAEGGWIVEVPIVEEAVIGIDLSADAVE